MDPGFPIGGHGPHRGAVDPRGGYVSKILHVKMKESGPVGGCTLGAPPLDPPMSIVIRNWLVIEIQFFITIPAATKGGFLGTGRGYPHTVYLYQLALGGCRYG